MTQILSMTLRDSTRIPHFLHSKCSRADRCRCLENEAAIAHSHILFCVKWVRNGNFDDREIQNSLVHKAFSHCHKIFCLNGAGRKERTLLYHGSNDCSPAPWYAGRKCGRTGLWEPLRITLGKWTSRKISVRNTRSGCSSCSMRAA